MITRYVLLLTVPALGLLLAIGLFVFSKRKPVSEADWARANDPVLAKLLSLNPGLEIEDEFARVPIYWIKIPASARRILVPKSEVQDARIRLYDCDPSAIPAQLLYPRRTEMACLEIQNADHTLQAFFFRTPDGMAKVMEFYQALLPADRRKTLGRGVNTWEEGREERPGESHELLYSYFFHQVAGVGAFVGYKEDKQ